MTAGPEGKISGETLELAQIRRNRELGALRIVALVRLGVAPVMVASSYVGLEQSWPLFWPLPWLYLLAAMWAAVVLFGPRSRTLAVSRLQLMLLLLDVGMVVAYNLATPDGAYIPLLILTLLPVMVVLDVSWRRAAVALVIVALTFMIEFYTDPILTKDVGYGRITLAAVVLIFLCGAVWLAVYAQGRQLDEIAELSLSRQKLLADLMTATDEERRTISESLHDGPLQSVLMARQDISGVLKKNPDPALERALEGLRDATAQMREATFELHPAVLAGAGLSRALTQLADATSARSGIEISTDIEHPGPDPSDRILFSVARELLSNVVRHSRATRATVTLRVGGGVSRLDVVDDGVGMTEAQAAERLRGGHIGLSSQRARIEAAGGSLRLIDTPKGTHIAVTVPRAGS